MNILNKAKVFVVTALFALTLVSCDDPAVNAGITAANTASQTVQVANDMVTNTVVDGCGAFNPCQ